MICGRWVSWPGLFYWGHMTSQYLWHAWATWVKFTLHDREIVEQFVGFLSFSEPAGQIFRGSLSQYILMRLSPSQSAKSDLWALEATIQFDQFDLRASGCQQQCWLKLSLSTVSWSVAQGFCMAMLKDEVLIWGQYKRVFLAQRWQCSSALSTLSSTFHRPDIIHLKG